MKAYKIIVDHSQNVDDIPSVHKLNKIDYVDLPQLLNSVNHIFHDKAIYARANFLSLDKYDFLSNDINIPIFSAKFSNLLNLDNLTSASVVPIVLIDDTYLDSPFDIGGDLKLDVPVRKDFTTLKFHDHYDFCNRELSVFRKLRSNPDHLGILRKPVLNEPIEGFPSIFKIIESISLLLISESVYIQALNAAVSGVYYEEVEVIEI